MDDRSKDRIIQKAQKFWDTGRYLEVGVLLFERIPRKYRPTWGAEILELACEFGAPSAEIEAVFELARNSDKWGQGESGNWQEAHRIVDKVNALHYQSKESLSKNIFTLAKNVAKVIYNAYSYPAPFDHSAGWEMAGNLWQVINLVNNPDFSTKAWASLCNKRFIELETPIVCCPGCPVCYVMFEHASDLNQWVAKVGGKSVTVEMISSIAGFSHFSGNQTNLQNQPAS